jgi:divalent metal cation (Fe/Co/Zn/Cd) transporter
MQIVEASPNIGRVGKVALYKTSEDLLKVDVECTFEQGDKSTIEQVHEQVSEIEKKIQAKFPGSIVTIHSEPE